MIEIKITKVNADTTRCHITSFTIPDSLFIEPGEPEPTTKFHKTLSMLKDGIPELEIIESGILPQTLTQAKEWFEKMNVNNDTEAEEDAND